MIGKTYIGLISAYIRKLFLCERSFMQKTAAETATTTIKQTKWCKHCIVSINRENFSAF